MQEWDDLVGPMKAEVVVLQSLKFGRNLDVDLRVQSNEPAPFFQL